MPIPRYVLSNLLMASTILIGFAVLMLGGWLSIGAGLIAATVIVALQFVLLRAFLGGDGAIRHGVAQLLDDPESAMPAIRSTSPAASDLWLDIMRLVRRLRQRIRRLEAELAASNAVLASLPDPILLINDDREVLRVNAATVELFGPNLLDRDLSVAIRNPAVLSAADAVIAGGEARMIEFDLAVPVDRHLRARLERLADGPADGIAVLMSLTDLTALKRAEQMRADFVANASHELRTPLSTLIGFIETLEGPAAEDAEARRRFLPIMAQQASRMARLVDDLLSLSRIELNEHLPPRSAIDLPHVLRTTIQGLDLKAGARRMRIALELGPAPAVVLGDAEELAQVFQNLIDNAIKYANEGSVISVASGASAKLRQGIAIAVRDRGEGIQRRHLPRLTERFYRVDTARSRAMGGTGLGLAIVKHIISRHRGLLEIDSVIGEGSVFTVHLPVAAALPQPVTAIRSGTGA
jgi:two-component system phosphate regulon sensor histidine kinase PhoR